MNCRVFMVKETPTWHHGSSNTCIPYGFRSNEHGSAEWRPWYSDERRFRRIDRRC